jgi:hypothetical protein
MKAVQDGLCPPAKQVRLADLWCRRPRRLPRLLSQYGTVPRCSASLFQALLSGTDKLTALSAGFCVRVAP